MATSLGEDGRESSDGCRSRANKLAGAAFSFSMRCRTVVTSPPPATHACSRVAAVDALFHGVVGRCRRRRVASRACAAPLGLERRGVVRAWTTTRSRRVTRGARPKELQFCRPPPGKLRLRRRPHRSRLRHPPPGELCLRLRHPLPGELCLRLRRRCRGPRATHHRGRVPPHRPCAPTAGRPRVPLPGELCLRLCCWPPRDLRLRLCRPPPSSVPPWPVLVRRVRRERDWDRDRRGADRWGPPIF